MIFFKQINVVSMRIPNSDITLPQYLNNTKIEMVIFTSKFIGINY